MSHYLDKEALLNEISRRVIQLDGQRALDDDLKQTVLAYIEALDEITDMDKATIEAIAHQVIGEYQLAAKSKPLLSKKMLLIITVGIAAILLLAIQTGKYLGLRESLTINQPANESQVNHRGKIIQTKLAQALTIISPLKIVAVDHYMNTLKFPTDFKEVGFNADDYVDGDLIKKVSFTQDGGILVDLGEGFDPNTRVLLQSDAFDNKDVVHWTCKTTIPQKYLGAIKAAPCVFTENL